MSFGSDIYELRVNRPKREVVELLHDTDRVVQILFHPEMDGAGRRGGENGVPGAIYKGEYGYHVFNTTHNDWSSRTTGRSTAIIEMFMIDRLTTDGIYIHYENTRHNELGCQCDCCVEKSGNDMSITVKQIRASPPVSSVVWKSPKAYGYSEVAHVFGIFCCGFTFCANACIDSKWQDTRRQQVKRLQVYLESGHSSIREAVAYPLPQQASAPRPQYMERPGQRATATTVSPSDLGEDVEIDPDDFESNKTKQFVSKTTKKKAAPVVASTTRDKTPSVRPSDSSDDNEVDPDDFEPKKTKPVVSKTTTKKTAPVVASTTTDKTTSVPQQTGSSPPIVVPLPPGRLGITFSGRPPVAHQVLSISSVKDQISEGMIVKALILEDGKVLNDMNETELCAALGKSKESEGRALVMMKPSSSAATTAKVATTAAPEPSSAPRPYVPAAFALTNPAPKSSGTGIQRADMTRSTTKTTTVSGRDGPRFVGTATKSQRGFQGTEKPKGGTSSSSTKANTVKIVTKIAADGTKKITRTILQPDGTERVTITVEEPPPSAARSSLGQCLDPCGAYSGGASVM